MSVKSLLPTAVFLLVSAGCQEVTAPEPQLEPSFGSAPSTAPGKIVFTDRVAMTFRGGSSYTKIFSMDEDGSGRTNLTGTLGANEGQPDLSPSGRWIAYARGGKIWKMTVSGTNQQQLTAGSGFDPAWSPDGTRIAYTRLVGSGLNLNKDIYVINADGTGEGGLVTEAGDQYMPTWSPGGDPTYVNRDTKGVFTIVGPGIPGIFHGNEPEWSPDGTKLAYHANRTYGVGAHPNDEIYIWELGDDFVTRVTFASDPLWDHQDPTWSPDGQGIAYVRHDNNFGASGRTIRWMDEFYFPHPVPLTAQGKNQAPSWGPCQSIPGGRTIC